MKKAAKEKTILLLAMLAIASIISAPSSASSDTVLASRNHVELFLLEGQNHVGESLFDTLKHVELEVSEWEVALGSSVAPKTGAAAFADEAAEIMDNAARSRGLNPSSGIRAAMKPRNIDTSKLIPPSSRPFADPNKLARHGAFDWDKYTPIIVETDGTRFWVMDGMTRIENARRAGITNLPAYVYPR